jgi:hypothetical protein
MAGMSPWLSNEARPKPETKVFQEEVLQFGKDLDVARLDATLPSERLGTWFFALVGPRADYLQWTTVDCGLPKPPPPPGTPICVRGQAKWRQDRAVIVVTIDVSAATTTALLSEPAVFAVTVMTIARAGASDAESDSIFGIWEGKRLGDLKELLDKATVRARGQP